MEKAHIFGGNEMQHGMIVLREEREKRLMSREALAVRAGLSVIWLRKIEAGEESPGPEARDRIRAALARCLVHESMGVECPPLPVPPDEELYVMRRRATER